MMISESKLHRIRKLFHSFNSFSNSIAWIRRETKQMLSLIRRKSIKIQNSFVSTDMKMFFDKCLMNWGIFICRMFIFKYEIFLRSSMNSQVFDLVWLIRYKWHWKQLAKSQKQKNFVANFLCQNNFELIYFHIFWENPIASLEHFPIQIFTSETLICLFTKHYSKRCDACQRYPEKSFLLLSGESGASERMTSWPKYDLDIEMFNFWRESLAKKIYSFSFEKK